MANQTGRRDRTIRPFQYGIYHPGQEAFDCGNENIHSALDNRETEAWQKLIRVLTHEIMNSITPIISLTELLTKYADNLEGDEDTKTEIRQMLQTIGRRGNGLVRFMNSYREVSHLPHPLLKLYNAGELLKEVVQLMQMIQMIYTSLFPTFRCA